MTSTGQSVGRRRGRRGPLPGSPRGPRLSKAERERQIIGVAESIFGERGFVNTTMDMVAEAAGITKPVIYDHFGSKEGLLAAVIDQAREDLTDAIVSAWRDLGPEASAKDSYRAGVRAYFGFMDHHATGWRGIVTSGQLAGVAGPSIETAREAQVRGIYEALRRFPNLAQVPDVLLQGTIEGLIGACERISMWRVTREDVDADVATEMVMSLTWYGIGGVMSEPPARVATLA